MRTYPFLLNELLPVLVDARTRLPKLAQKIEKEIGLLIEEKQKETPFYGEFCRRADIWLGDDPLLALITKHLFCLQKREFYIEAKGEAPRAKGCPFTYQHEAEHIYHADRHRLMAEAKKKAGFWRVNLNGTVTFVAKPRERGENIEPWMLPSTMVELAKKEREAIEWRLSHPLTARFVGEEDFRLHLSNIPWGGDFATPYRDAKLSVLLKQGKTHEELDLKKLRFRRSKDGTLDVFPNENQMLEIVSANAQGAILALSFNTQETTDRFEMRIPDLETGSKERVHYEFASDKDATAFKVKSALVHLSQSSARAIIQAYPWVRMLRNLPFDGREIREKDLEFCFEG